MLNEVALVGRLTENPEVVELESGKKRTSIILAVPRSYKNVDGIYETDFIKLVLWNGIAANAKEFCKCGDIIGVKGRIQVSTYDDAEGNKKTVTEVVAEKISFLSSKPKEAE